jgi:hypothetical protein
LGTHKGVQVSEENVVEGAKGSRDMVKWRLTEVKIVWGGHRSVSFYSYTMRPRHVSCTELTISFQLICIPLVPIPSSTEQVGGSIVAGLYMTRFESCLPSNGYPDQDFTGFSESFQVNGWILYWNRPQPLPIKSLHILFTINDDLRISFNVTQGIHKRIMDRKFIP